MIIPSTSGRATAQQDNQGYAQVLKTTRFDGPTFIQNLAIREQERKRKEFEDGIERKRRNAQFMTKLPSVKDFTPYIEKELATELDAAELALAELSAQQGVDLTMEPKGYEIVREYTDKINRLQGYGREIQDAVDMYAAKLAANPEKYDAQQFTEWAQKMKQINGIEAKREYALNTPPWEEKFEVIDFLNELPIDKSVIEQGNKTITQYDYDGVLSAVRQSLYDMNQTPDKKKILEEGYNEGVKNGLWNDMAGMEKYLADLKMDFGGIKETYDEPRTSSTFNFRAAFGAGVGGTKTNQIAAVYEPKFGGDGTKVNALVTQSSTGDTRPMEFLGDGVGSDGEPERLYVKPGSAIKVNDDGTFTLTGTKARRISSDQIKQSASSANTTPEAMFASMMKRYGQDNVFKEDDGTVVIIEGEQKKVTIKEGDANYTQLKLLYQTDPIELIKEKNAELAAGKKTGQRTPAKPKASSTTLGFFETGK